MHSSCQEGPNTVKKLVQQMPILRRQACLPTLDGLFPEFTELFFFFFETGFLCVALAALELTL